MWSPALPALVVLFSCSAPVGPPCRVYEVERGVKEMSCADGSSENIIPKFPALRRYLNLDCSSAECKRGEGFGVK